MDTSAAPSEPVTGEFVISDARFVEGGALPELRLRYTTLGRLRRDAAGRATNAVLLLHGTGGSGRAFLRPQFADLLFGPGQPLDANDLLYQVEASRDYDPTAHLERITAPLLAINFADDLVNPPELGILEHEIQRVPRGAAVVIPASEQSHGHRGHSWPVLWQAHLARLLDRLPPLEGG